MSNTQVPIQPIKKGSLLRLWLGLLLIALIAVGLAWQGTRGAVATSCQGIALDGPGETRTTASGLKFKTIKAGKGPSPTDSDLTLINYKGTLRDGTQFDAGQAAEFPVTGVIPGFTEALKMAQRGGSYRFCIPSNLAYGNRAMGDAIPANSPLVFEIDLLEFKNKAEVDMMRQMLQQQQQGAQPQGQPAQPQAQ